MASQKFGFVTVDPVSGSGDQAVSISGDKYTGRLERTANLIVVTNGGVQKALVVNQAAAAESVTSDSPTATVAKTGGNVTITGKSNSTKLTFAATPAEENGLTLQLPENYTAAGKQTANGAIIADDPGATGELFGVLLSPMFRQCLYRGVGGYAKRNGCRWTKGASYHHSSRW